jgi:hypothetical protein
MLWSKKIGYGIFLAAALGKLNTHPPVYAEGARHHFGFWHGPDSTYHWVQGSPLPKEAVKPTAGFTFN